MKKLLLFTLVALFATVRSFALTPITGPDTVCAGSTIYLSDTLSPGGLWSSSDITVATIGSTSGVVTGVAAGTATITYTLMGTYVTYPITVDAAPSPIVGGTSPICTGATTTLSDPTPGGIWVSFSSYIATVGSTGVVTGVHGGTTTIEYYDGSTGCSSYATVTVNAAPSVYIGGPSTVCLGSTMTLVDSGGTGGTWSSSDPTIASVGSSTGVVTGVSTGTVTITLALTGACGTGYAYHTVTVINTTSAGTITGPTSVVVGSTITLSDPTASPGTYAWSSSATSIATIGSSSGVVTGVSAGVTTISYAVTGCGGTAYATYSVTVNPFDGISGHVNFTSGSYYGNVKVYLITYNPLTLDLEALDSMTGTSTGTSMYYQFTGVATDSYRVKAAVIDTFSGMFTTGYIPTYHISHFYWHDADVIYHVSGTSDINEDINMSYGTLTSGPGFIGGNVLAGANRHTSGGVPVVGLRMCILNAATNQLMGAAYTNTSGTYSFSNLPVGQTYYVFPDSINYITTPYTGITLTSAAPGVSAASFTQHTVSKTIKPVTELVPQVTPSVSFVTTYPNPASSKLNIQWSEVNDETASVAITDVAGRKVYTSTLKLTRGTGTAQVDLSGITNGVYVISVQSANIDYSNKIEVQR